MTHNIIWHKNIKDKHVIMMQKEWLSQKKQNLQFQICFEYSNVFVQHPQIWTLWSYLVIQYYNWFDSCPINSHFLVILFSMCYGFTSVDKAVYMCSLFNVFSIKSCQRHFVTSTITAFGTVIPNDVNYRSKQCDFVV